MTQIQTTNRIHQVSSKASGDWKLITRIRAAGAIWTRRARALNRRTIPWSSFTLPSFKVDISSQQKPLFCIQRSIGLAEPLNHRREFIQPRFDRLRPVLLLRRPSLPQMPVKRTNIVDILIQRSRRFPPSLDTVSTCCWAVARPSVFLRRSIVDALGSVLHTISAHGMHLIAIQQILSRYKSDQEGRRTLSHFTFRLRQVWQL